MKRLLSLLTIAAICCGSVFAATPEVDRESGVICIEGNTAPNTTVTLLVLKENSSLADLDEISEDELMTVADYIDETVSGESGSFSFYYRTIKNDEYSRFIAFTNETNGETESHELRFSFYTQETIDKTARDVASCTTAEEVQAVLTPTALEMLGAETVFYEKVPDAQRLSVCRVISENSSSDAAAIRNGFFDASLLVYLNGLKSTAEIDEFYSILTNMNKMHEICGFDTNDALYKNMGNGRTDINLRVLRSFPIISKEDIRVKFSEAFALSAVKAYKYTYTKQILTDYTNVLGIDMSKLTAANETSVMKGLAGNNYSTSADLKKAYDQLVSSPSGSESSGKGNKPGSSFSGGGGGGGSYAKPSNKEKKDEADDKKEKKKDESEGNGRIEFRDMPKEHFAYAAAKELSGKGIITGYPDGCFMPEKTVSRAEFIAMLTRAFGIKNNGFEKTFSDLRPDDWYYESVASAVSSGIVNGISDDEIGAAEEITREDICVLIYRTIKLCSIIHPDEAASETVIFSDAEEISDYAKESVEYLAKEKVVSGSEDGFLPGAAATRAECAKIIYNVLEVVQ